MIFVQGKANLNVSDSSFTNCWAISDGGSIQTAGSVMVSIFNSIFESLLTKGSGGAVTVNGGQLILSSVLFRNCSAFENGGAVYVVGSHSWILDVVFDNCTSSGGGGAVVINGGSSTINNTMFLNCSSKQDGGAMIQNHDAVVNLSHSNFTNLSSGGYGGAISFVGGRSRIFLTSFLSCKSSKGGGAIFASQSP